MRKAISTQCQKAEALQAFRDWTLPVWIMKRPRCLQDNGEGTQNPQYLKARMALTVYIDRITVLSHHPNPVLESHHFDSIAACPASVTPSPFFLWPPASFSIISLLAMSMVFHGPLHLMALLFPFILRAIYKKFLSGKANSLFTISTEVCPHSSGEALKSQLPVNRSHLPLKGFLWWCS